MWEDVDGVGVNDVAHKLKKDDRKDLDNCVLDFNRDGCNDVTGDKYTAADFHGRRRGFIDEITGKIQGKFWDENGNGLDDRMEAARERHHGNRDLFIDEDGDGICDGRGDGGRQHRGARKQHGRTLIRLAAIGL